MLAAMLSPMWRVPFWCLRVLLWIAMPPLGWWLSRVASRRRRCSFCGGSGHRCVARARAGLVVG